jgi:hypothetical protein
MKFNSSLKAIVVSLITLTSLSVQKPVFALVNPGKYETNAQWNTSNKIPVKPPIQIARDDQYWGPQRDFEIQMPGEVVENTKGHLITTNTTTQTVYMIFHEDLPSNVNYWTSEETREVLQSAMRKNLDTKGKVVKSTNMVIEGYPGIELLIQHSDGTQGQYQGYVVRRRLYLIGARTFDELTTEATNFFDSFRIYPTRIVRSE